MYQKIIPPIGIAIACNRHELFSIFFSFVMVIQLLFTGVYSMYANGSAMKRAFLCCAYGKAVLHIQMLCAVIYCLSYFSINSFASSQSSFSACFKSIKPFEMSPISHLQYPLFKNRYLSFSLYFSIKL